MNVSVLGYCWEHNPRRGLGDHPYLKYYTPPLELCGVNMSINHLAVKINDWVIHPLTKGFNQTNTSWVKEKVSLRVFGTPKEELFMGSTTKLLHEIVEFVDSVKLAEWSAYLWFYTFGLYKNKRDCIYFTKELLHFCLGIEKGVCLTPYNYFKEISNHGYGSA
jgi:hypothetical protein